MLDDLVLSPDVSFYIGALVQWGFLMAFLYSFVSSINKPDKKRVWLSLVMTVSYLSSLFIDIQTVLYLDFFYFDMATIFALVVLNLIIKERLIFAYLLVGLSVNAILFLGMHLDTVVYNNYEPWLFTIVYSWLVNFNDFAMVAVFFIKKDFLGLVKAKLCIYKKLSRSV
ncbi:MULTISPECIES: hypothetical protein [unclassified Pseudoalteromonas]|uniref:hypothetical protein n=1 Tax=unclassified Pseudoalteromonas TaxID=194690 RepID=UPI0007314D8C|nr:MULTISPECIES: hypothetical protein [unclassified Pseudoalteromonas]KTD95619.1 hypothetical protein ATS71_04900 [Pseudoalteromonas sp. H71]TMN80564.1 hypothetical protein CWB64_12880 [Pseudoalteromonas sp. S410]TMN89851.1 hypothetical protein CWB62_12450 [Pseudoalteromonas sp. S408]TMN97682.1 hypothetical protein CWB61_09215 [Pseudoalteromonas sp. S407]TMO02152.1 hypothetical protein CWB63_02030 [Pseudoalteromonas sp. S409]